MNHENDGPHPLAHNVYRVVSTLTGAFTGRAIAEVLLSVKSIHEAAQASPGVETLVTVLPTVAVGAVFLLGSKGLFRKILDGDE